MWRLRSNYPIVPYPPKKELGILNIGHRMSCDSHRGRGARCPKIAKVKDKLIFQYQKTDLNQLITFQSSVTKALNKSIYLQKEQKIWQKSKKTEL